MDVDATEVALTTVPNPVNVGGTVTFTATVAPSVALASSANGPDGTVSFYVCPSGTASCTASNGTELSGAAVTLSGTSPYTAVLPLAADAADSLGEGSYAIGATYTSSDGEFTGSSTTVSLTVGLNAPVITWTPAPTSIVYGTQLIAAQLDATATDPTTHASVPGTPTYYFPAGTVIQVGTVLPAGMDDLQVTFTPTDGLTYSTAGASTTLTVTPATLTVTADPKSMVYGGTVPPLTYTITGFVNADPSTVVTGTATCVTTATSTSPVGTYPITCSGSLSASNYVFSFTPGTLTVTAGTTLTILTLPTASPITYGQTLLSSVLGICTGSYDGATVPGSCTWTNSSFAPGAGTPSEGITFTATNSSDYNTATGSVTVTVNKATPTISTLPTASTISSGQPLSSSTFSGGTVTSGTTTVTGTFTWTTGTIVPAVGTDPENVTFTPDDTADYNSVPTTVNVTVNNKGTPTVTDWPTASGITYGATLSSSTLSPVTAVSPGSPTTPGSASVAGTFTWSNGGLIPTAGTDSESVTFTPTDVTDYNTVGGAVTVVVSKATPTISTLPTASVLSAGQALSASTFLGGTATSGTSTVTGSFTWNAPTTVPPTGSTPEGVTFTPTDTVDYNSVTLTVTITVNSKGTPTVTAWPTASAIYYDQTLLSSVLTGGTASVPGTFNWTNSGLLPTAGTDLESVTFTPNDTIDYNTVTNTAISVTVYKVTPTITAPPTASAISVGQTLLASTLVGGTVSYNGTPVTGTFSWTSSGTTPPAGSDPESVTFTPNDTLDYYSLTTTVTVAVNNKTTPTITAPPTATGLTYGETLASSTLSGGTASVAGGFAWTTSTTVPQAGTPSESVTFTPSNTTLYNTVTFTITVAVSKATPTISTLPTASTITVGQTLVASTLTGGTATSGTTTVTGLFTWTTSGTVPPLGSTPEGVTFTPTNTTDYNSATTTVTVTVDSKTTPTITAPPTATGITYGETLASSTLSGGTASVAGSFAWTTSTTAPGVGTPSESVTFTPTNTALYNTATTTVTLTVSKATPTVSTLPTASAISVGQALSASTLSGGIATSGGTTVTGSFTWTTGTNVPPTGSTPEGVTFTPTDTADYNTATTTVTVTVNNKTTPTITAPPTATGITFGQTLASSTLSGGTVSSGGTTLTGSFAWTTSTTAPGAGTPTESVTFTPTDTTDYNTVTTTITVTVSKATPTVSTLPTASAITTGQALSASTLLGGIATSGTTTVAGLFTWTTGTTVPPTGSTAEGVTFTPTDTADYNTATTTVTVTVNGKTTPTVTAWPTASAIYYDQTLLSSVLTGGTASVGGTTLTGTFAWTTPTTLPTAGTDLESVTFTPSDTTDYSTVTNTISVTVYKVTPTISVPPTASTIGTGQTLASSTLLGGTAASGATTVAGLFTWTTPAIAPPLGTTSESVTFTPSDTADYNTATGSVSVTVNGKTTPTVTAWPTASTIGLGQTLASSMLSGGTASVGGSFTWTAPATAPPLGTTSESVTFTPSDTTDYNTVTGPVSVTVSSSVQAISFSTPAQVAYGTAPMLLSATGGASGNPVTFLIVSGPGSLNGNTLVITGVGTITISANQAGNSNYSAATQVMQSIVVTPVALTLTANNATKVYGTANPALTGTVTGAVNGDAFTDSFLTSATSTSGAGDYVIVPSATGTNIGDYNVTLQDGMLTITQAGTTTTLNLSNPTLDPGQSVTLTALVAPATTGTPTGSVSFYDGTTLLNTAPLSGGTATYTVSGYSAGTTHQLTAVYSGDTNFLSSSTGSSIQLGVASLDFTIAVTGSATSTVSPGSSATYQLTVSPLYGSYPGQVSFAAAGLPSTTTTTFSPSAIAAGAGPQTVTMTVQTSAAAKLAYPEIGRKLAPIAFALLLIPLFGGGKLRRQARRMSKLASILLLLGCTLVGAMMTGCGGAAFQQLSQQYTITVTATSGNLQHTAPVTLMIK